MSNSYWLKQERKFLTAIKSVKIPDEQLHNADSITKIPSGGGCNWICIMALPKMM
jgi:hypothetical protein